MDSQYHLVCHWEARKEAVPSATSSAQLLDWYLVKHSNLGRQQLGSQVPLMPLEQSELVLWLEHQETPGHQELLVQLEQPALLRALEQVEP